MRTTEVCKYVTFGRMFAAQLARLSEFSDLIVTITAAAMETIFHDHLFKKGVTVKVCH